MSEALLSRAAASDRAPSSLLSLAERSRIMSVAFWSRAAASARAPTGSTRLLNRLNHKLISLASRIAARTGRPDHLAIHTGAPALAQPPSRPLTPVPAPNSAPRTLGGRSFARSAGAPRAAVAAPPRAPAVRRSPCRGSAVRPRRASRRLDTSSAACACATPPPAVPLVPLVPARARELPPSALLVVLRAAPSRLATPPLAAAGRRACPSNSLLLCVLCCRG